MPVKEDRSVGWTRRSAAVSLLLAMETHRKEAGLRLVQLREAKGWNQEDLAHASKLSVKTISRFENGRHDGRKATIDRLAEALGVDRSVIEGRPPAPLGLGDDSAGDQLDRIEQLLVDLSERQARAVALLEALTLGRLEDEAERPPRAEPGDTGAAGES